MPANVDLFFRYYNAKRALLENELRDLYELKHPKYLAFVRRLEENFIDDCEGIDEEVST